MKNVIKSLIHIASTAFEICWVGWNALVWTCSAGVIWNSCGYTCLMSDCCHALHLQGWILSGQLCLYDFKDAVVLYTSWGYRSLEFGGWGFLFGLGCFFVGVGLFSVFGGGFIKKVEKWCCNHCNTMVLSSVIIFNWGIEWHLWLKYISV